MKTEVFTQRSGPERRRYYRLQPRMPEKIEASIFFLDGKHCTAEVVNFSPAGLLCFCTQWPEKFHLDDIFQRIDLHIPNKPIVTYSGRVVRKESTADPKAFYFAIKFERFGGKEGVAVPSKKKNSPLKADVDALFLTRLRQAENYLRAPNFYEETRLRTRVYRAFQDVTDRLRLEEKWFFLELLDELKREEPDYSPGLLREFLRLCRGEDRLPEAKEAGKLPMFFSKFFHLAKK